VQGERWFTDGYVLEEGVYGGQPVVSCPRAVAAVKLEVLQELPEERSIEVFDAQFGGRPSEALRGELEQQAKGVSVGRYGVWACAKLL